MNSFSTSFKAFALVALLSVLNVNAMEDKDISLANTSAPASNAAAPVSSEINPTTPAVEPLTVDKKIEIANNAYNNEVKKENASKGAKSKGWDFSKAIGDSAIVKTFNDMKNRGWSKWSFNEKAGVVFGAVAILAAAYLGYQYYQSFTTQKSKVKKARA